MDIHEYQAKSILEEYGLNIPTGGLAYSPDQAAYQAHEIGGDRWVVKAQVHTGGRGKAGGIRICEDDQQVWDCADEMLGSRLVTEQTGLKGKGVYRLYVEEASSIEDELYVAFVLDRSTERVACVASEFGGMEVEEIAANQPQALNRVSIEPAVGLQAFQARQLAFSINLPVSLVNPWTTALLAMYRAFCDFDATLIEVNPLAVTTEGHLVALDAKMSFDDNATFRHPRIGEFRDKSQEDPRERAAIDRGLSYVGLDGDIGCIINGAGLAMATMDMIKHAGGEPANFLDIGGGASPERVAKAFRVVLTDDNVKAVLINIFAGINRCDWVAEGILQAMRTVDISVPVVVRLAGTNAELGRSMLQDQGSNVIAAETLEEAGFRAVEAVAAAGLAK